MGAVCTLCIFSYVANSLSRSSHLVLVNQLHSDEYNIRYRFEKFNKFNLLMRVGTIEENASLIRTSATCGAFVPVCFVSLVGQD